MRMVLKNQAIRLMYGLVFFLFCCNPGNFCKLLMILAFHKLLMLISGSASQYTLILEN